MTDDKLISNLELRIRQLTNELAQEKAVTRAYRRKWGQFDGQSCIVVTFETSRFKQGGQWYSRDHVGTYLVEDERTGVRTLNALKSIGETLERGMTKRADVVVEEKPNGDFRRVS